MGQQWRFDTGRRSRTLSATAAAARGLRLPVRDQWRYLNSKVWTGGDLHETAGWNMIRDYTVSFLDVLR